VVIFAQCGMEVYKTIGTVRNRLETSDHERGTVPRSGGRNCRRCRMSYNFVQINSKLMLESFVRTQSYCSRTIK